MSLLPLDQARHALLAAAPAPPVSESIALAEARGRVLAVPVHALLDVPPCDNSAMDGYALAAADSGQELAIALTFSAGDAPGELPPGTAARIFTGAPIPAGADAVVPQEDCERHGERVAVPSVPAGQHVRRRGQDTRRGDLLLQPGRRLRPQDLGLLASQGIADVEVFRPLRVALLCTGSELREAGGGKLAPGQIYNSNRPMLAALLEALGCEVVDLGIVVDDPEATAAALREAAGADLIVSSGGVSVGDADHVRDQVAALGAIELWRIAIKPGKPFAFGRVADTPFLGLPGNPVSAFVTFVMLARPFICAAQGRIVEEDAAIVARADFRVGRPGSRQEFLRATLQWREGELWASACDNQSSGVLSSVTGSTALAIVPLGQTIAHGDRVSVLPLDALLY